MYYHPNAWPAWPKKQRGITLLEHLLILLIIGCSLVWLLVYLIISDYRISETHFHAHPLAPVSDAQLREIHKEVVKGYCL